jgi:hypothetical protein
MVQQPGIPTEPSEPACIGPVWIAHKNITSHIRKIYHDVILLLSLQLGVGTV